MKARPGILAEVGFAVGGQQIRFVRNDREIASPDLPFGPRKEGLKQRQGRLTIARSKKRSFPVISASRCARSGPAEALANRHNAVSPGHCHLNCSRFPGSRDHSVLLYLSLEQQLPMAHTPNIDVHEVGAAIVPHSSAMQAQGRVPQLRGWNPK